MPGSVSGPIVILAGSGRLPLQLADALRASGREHRVLAFRGFAETALRKRADAVVDLLDVKRALACLRDWGAGAVALAGGVRRPNPSAVIGAFSVLRNREEIATVMARGDDNLLRGVVDLLESHGFPVIGAHDIAPALLASPGVLGRHAPGAEDRRSIETGFRLLDCLSPYDVGQAAVIVGERVVAVEGPEGTDRMLRRARGFRRAWPFRGGGAQGGAQGGVLVKSAKRTQDLRVDMPAIGPRTVVEAARAGLRGIAVGAGSTLVLDRDAALATADRLGFFLCGVERTPS